MCLGKAEQPATESGRNYVKITRLLIVAQFVITVLNFVAADYFLREAIFGLMFLLLLYAAQHHLSYQVLMIYIFISIFFAFRFLLFFLEPIQNRKAIASLESMQQVAFYIAIVSFAYYLFCIFFFYFPYKEFKIQAYLHNPALRNYFQRELDNNQHEEEAKNVDYGLNYGDIPIHVAKKNSGHGTFEVEKGKGIVIG